jgi:hypothetical protein
MANTSLVIAVPRPIIVIIRWAVQVVIIGTAIRRVVQIIITAPWNSAGTVIFR